MSDVYLIISLIMMLPLSFKLRDIFFGRITFRDFKNDNSRENNAIKILGLIGFILLLLSYF